MGKNRLHKIDNIKAFLIFLVVFGHLIEPFISSTKELMLIFILVYIFHMPMFVLISGMFSKTVLTDNMMLKNVKNILIPFIFFNFLYEGIYYIATGKVSQYISNGAPYWIMWFLLSLFVWKILLIVLNKFKYPILSSILISLGVSFFSGSGYFLGISRIFTFLPFFMLGSRLTKSFLLSKFFKYKFIFLFIVGLLVLLINVFIDDIDRQWLYGSYSFNHLHVSYFVGAITRVCYYLFVIIFGISIISLLPDKKTFFTYIGKYTLPIYLLHGFIILGLVSFHGLDYIYSLIGVYGYILFAIILSALILVILSSKKILLFFELIMSKVSSFLLAANNEE